MKNIKFYNIFLFISTFTRNIIDIYSVIYLYLNNFSIKDIFGIYVLIYFFGSIISTITLYLGNKIGYKYLYILSSIFTSISFYILQKSHNVYLIAIFISLAIFTYHPIKHYYGIKLLNKKKAIGMSLILIYLATFISSYFVIKKINIIYLIIISVLGIIPALFIKKNPPQKIKIPKGIPKSKLRFFIFDQFKIIFLLLEPLYLYTISKTVSFVGIFNIIITFSSVTYLYFISNKINLEKTYKYINLIFVIILLMKLNILDKKVLMIIAFFEGIGIKTNELVSTINLYNYTNKQKQLGYIILSEIIFCLTRTIILAILYLSDLSLLTSLYILLEGIFILSFQYKIKKQ